MEPMFFAVFVVNVRHPIGYLPGDAEDGCCNDGCQGDYWSGTEEVYDVPVGYGDGNA